MPEVTDKAWPRNPIDNFVLARLEAEGLKPSPEADKATLLQRDWVIKAYDQNMPYDEYTIEQIAGDLLPNATMDQKIASGFNRNHMITLEGGAIPAEYHVEYVVDRVSTTSTDVAGNVVDKALV